MVKGFGLTSNVVTSFFTVTENYLQSKGTGPKYSARAYQKFSNQVFGPFPKGFTDRDFDEVGDGLRPRVTRYKALKILMKARGTVTAGVGQKVIAMEYMTKSTAGLILCNSTDTGPDLNTIQLIPYSGATQFFSLATLAKEWDIGTAKIRGLSANAAANQGGNAIPFNTNLAMATNGPEYTDWDVLAGAAQQDPKLASEGGMARTAYEHTPTYELPTARPTLDTNYWFYSTHNRPAVMFTGVATTDSFTFTLYRTSTLYFETFDSCMPLEWVPLPMDVDQNALLVLSMKVPDGVSGHSFKSITNKFLGGVRSAVAGANNVLNSSIVQATARISPKYRKAMKVMDALSVSKDKRMDINSLMRLQGGAIMNVRDLKLVGTEAKRIREEREFRKLRRRMRKGKRA
jgi:hypothetical protein